MTQLLVLQWKCNIFLAGTLLENGTTDFSLWAIGGPTLLCLYRIATHMPLMKLEACHSRFTGDTQVACRWWHATICYKWLESGLPISAYHFSASGGPAVSNVALPLYYQWLAATGGRAEECLLGSVHTWFRGLR